MLSSGDSGSNLGSLNERQIVTKERGGAGRTQLDSSEKSATFGSGSNLQFEEIESE